MIHREFRIRVGTAAGLIVKSQKSEKAEQDVQNEGEGVKQLFKNRRGWDSPSDRRFV